MLGSTRSIPWRKVLNRPPLLFGEARHSLLEVLVERLVDRDAFRRRHGVDLLEQLAVWGFVPRNLTDKGDLMVR